MQLWLTYVDKKQEPGSKAHIILLWYTGSINWEFSMTSYLYKMCIKFLL